jgi:hypothetical protein
MVYVRKGGQPGPLAPPYSGLYRVISKGPTYFSIDGQRPVQSDKQGAYVLQHRRTAAGCHGGPPQTAYGNSSLNTSSASPQGAATGGKTADTDNAPQPAQEDTFPRPASDNRRTASARTTPASKIRPLSDNLSDNTKV